MRQNPDLDIAVFQDFDAVHACFPARQAICVGKAHSRPVGRLTAGRRERRTALGFARLAVFL